MRKDWLSTTLGEICAVDWGNTNLTKTSYVDGGRFLAVSASGCDGRIGHAEHKALTPVLSAIGAKCGRMFLPVEDFTAIKNTITLTPQSQMCSGVFLYHLLTHIELPKRGAAQPFISKGDIQQFPIQIPSLSEQQRIVEILDKAFDGIAKARANAEQNLRNVAELLGNFLSDEFEQNGDGWVTKRIEELIKIRSGDFLPAKAMKSSGTIDVYGGNGVTGKHDQNNLSGTNIVIGRVGAKCGNVRLVQGKLWLTDNAFYVCDYLEKMSKEFLAMKLELADLRKYANQMAQPVISYKTIKEIEISFPGDVKVQERIIQRKNIISDYSASLAKLISQKLFALDDLKASILHQAFSGNL